MRVIELVIDGFKSYAVRTVISGWDDSFNAITGLNGSGKSNILDAICFVLGITAMGVVRAQNLQDLIYKRGQAGVTKASVTIVFDNRDKSKSPIGFEDSAQISVTRQIVLGGTSKYLINGHRAQQQTVQNLFHSVQLNINNPNFLIMQGRITKVLNMKPVEILSMIEEAAGTRMFEDRRDKALKTMAKKETKVQEIDSLLKEEIEPKLEKLRNEKRAFLDFQQTQSDLERLTRLVVSYDYMRGSEKSAKSTTELDRVKTRGRELEGNAERMKHEISNLEEDLQKVMATRDKELRKGGKFLKLEEQVKNYEHDLVRLATSADLKRASYDEEKSKRTELEKARKESKTQADAKAKALQKLQSQYESMKEKHDKKVATIDENEELLQTLQTGVASRAGQESGYQGQLQTAKAQANDALTQQEQAKLKINHLTARIKEDEPKAKKAQTQNAGMLKEIEALKTHAAKLEKDLQKLGYEPGKEDELSERENALEKEIQDKKQQLEALRRKVSNIDFSYSDPAPNFDRSKVKGVVAQLFTLDETKSQAGTALEICAGGRLYNVVVDTAETGSQLLQNGKLRKRVTIIPLNKISTFKASAEKLGAAQKIAPGKVNLALDLVGYDEEVTAAIEYVFGSTLITADADAAKRVTFDPNVRLKSVTLEGDVYDPSGTLSGGSAPSSAGVLLTMQKIHKLNQEISKLGAELVALRQQMAAEKKKMDGAKALKKEYDLKLHEITLKEKQINGNASSDIVRAVEEMKASIEQLKADIVTAKSKHSELLKDIKRIEKDMAEFSSNKGSKLAELQKSLETMRKDLAKSSTELKNAQNELQEARLEAEQVDGDLSGLVDQLDELSASLASQEQELQQLEAEQLKIKEASELAQADLADERAKLSSFDDEIRSLQQASKAKSAQITKEGLEMQTLKHQVEKLQKEQSALAATLTHLESEHEWIADEKKAFGKPGSPYDFKQHDMVESKSSLKTITERFQGMKKKINPKVMNMIDSVEKKEVSLKNMMRTVIRDKRKIEDTIATLDEYKKTALEKTWKKVDGDFGKIFADLLPGSFAKLVAPEGQTIADGLEVKVQLGKVWKASLTELSGGQRSLIALSLILSLLQFKPAPLYILDEVDAALDPSHTQNIGHLIKTRFKGSQFIIVSLKEGMFGNANRLYQIRFVDGTSVVTASRGDDAGK